jgi:hypothetical protein
MPLTQETLFELVLRAIAGLKMNDETPHIQKLQLCIALARGVLNLKPGEEPTYVLGDKLKIHESRISPHSPYHFGFPIGVDLPQKDSNG